MHPPIHPAIHSTHHNRAIRRIRLHRPQPPDKTARFFGSTLPMTRIAHHEHRRSTPPFVMDPPQNLPYGTRTHILSQNPPQRFGSLRQIYIAESPGIKMSDLHWFLSCFLLFFSEQHMPPSSPEPDRSERHMEPPAERDR